MAMLFKGRALGARRAEREAVPPIYATQMVRLVEDCEASVHEAFQGGAVNRGINLETSVGRSVVYVHRGAGQGVRAWMLPLQRLYSHGLPLAGATRNGRSIPRRSNAAIRREGRTIRFVATSPNGWAWIYQDDVFCSFSCVPNGAVNCGF